MELINNRFRILKNIAENPEFSSYLVLDVWRKKKVQLNLLHSQAIPETLIDFYTNEFIDLISLNHDNLIHNYDFNIVTHIDNKRYDKKNYFYTCDYSERVDLFSYIKEKGLVEILDLFLEVLKVVKYLHLKNRTYGEINLDNVMIVREKGGYRVKIKDLATIEMERQLFLSGDTSNLFKSHELSVTEKVPIKSDIYALGILLLNLINREPINNLPLKRLEELRHNRPVKSNKDKKMLKQLTIIINDMLLDRRYVDILEVAKDIGQVIGKEYSIIDLERLDMLNMHPKIVGREEELFTVLKSYKDMGMYKSYGRIFFIKGYEGSGKTRYLEEMKFLLELKGANVLSSFVLGQSANNSHKMWVEILRKLILEAKQDTIDKYLQELVKYFPELSDMKGKAALKEDVGQNNKLRLLNRIAGFISEVVKDMPTVIIIDNLHYADEFTIETINYLITSDSTKKNLLFLLSYNEAETHNRNEFLVFVSNVKKIQDSDIIKMQNLTIKETSEMIKNILSLPNIPMKLGERIYNHSFGNPLFIIEAIKDFYTGKTLRVLPETGEWDIILPEPNGYEKLEIPNSIEQAVMNQIVNLDLISHEVLKIISIFNLPVAIEDIVEFTDTSEDVMLHIIQSLVNKGLLSKKVHDTGYVYDFNNKVLKGLVYGNLDPNEKKLKHEKAAYIIERQKDNHAFIGVDELLFHLQKAEKNKKVKEYALSNARAMQSLKNYREQVKNLEIALNVCTDNREFGSLLLKIGEILLDMGDSSLAKEYLYKAEKTASKIKNKELQIDVFLNLASCYSSEGKIKECEGYLSKVDELLKATNYEKARLDRMVFEALAQINSNNLDASQRLCEEILHECDEKYNKIRGNVIRVLAYIQLRKNNLDEAIRLNYKSIEILETVNYAKGILYALNNIGVIFAEHYGDVEQGIKYFARVRDLSEEYGLLSTQVLGTVNVGVMTKKRLNFKAAYENYKHALSLAKKINVQSEIYFIYTSLINLCIEIDNYEEACHYFELCNEDLAKFSVHGEKKLAVYQTFTFLHQTFGNFAEAARYSQKSIEYERTETADINPVCIMQEHIIRLLSLRKDCHHGLVDSIIETSQKLITTAEKITSLSEAATIVGRRGDFKRADKLVAEIEKYMDSKTHEFLMAKYLLAKGVSDINSGLIYLKQALALGKKVSSKSIVLKSNLELADKFFDKEEYYEAAYYYVEAWEMFKGLLIQLPDKFKLNFANNFGFIKSFYRAMYIKEILGVKPKTKFSILDNLENIETVASLEQLQELLEYNLVKIFVNSKRFMEKISKKSIASLSNLGSEIEILTRLTGDTIKDIELVVKFLGAKMLATRGVIILQEHNQNVEVIASSDGSYRLPANKHYYEKVKLTHEPIVVYRGVVGDKELLHLSEEISACICIPITNHYTQGVNAKITSKILGYLYLESDRVLNNFGTDGIENCSTLNNLLALLIEKHQLKISASIDKLTGTLTRKYLEDNLTSVFENAAENKEVFSMLMYDLDRFKGINDRFGHQTGDEVLSKLTKIIMDAMEQENHIGRYGGEEFVVILPGVGSEEAFNIAESLRKQVEERKILGEKAKVTISIGVASYPDQGRNVTDLIEKADQALYMAKENGRNRTEVWKREFGTRSKTNDNLRGIISGDPVKDSRNMLAMVELTQLINKNISREEKIYSFMGRMIETIEAQSGTLLLLANDNIYQKFGRRTQSQGWNNSIEINENFVDLVIAKKEGIYTIDWDDMGKNELISGISNWSSVVVAPMVVRDEVKGILYFKSSTRNKEFDYSDLSIVTLLGDLMATVV